MIDYSERDGRMDDGFPPPPSEGYPVDPYDEDRYCQWCGNGAWKHHAPYCRWADDRDGFVWADTP